MQWESCWVTGISIVGGFQMLLLKHGMQLWWRRGGSPTQSFRVIHRVVTLRGIHVQGVCPPPKKKERKKSVAGFQHTANWEEHNKSLWIEPFGQHLKSYFLRMFGSSVPSLGGQTSLKKTPPHRKGVSSNPDFGHAGRISNNQPGC